MSGQGPDCNMVTLSLCFLFSDISMRWNYIQMPGGHKAGLLEGNYQPVLYCEHAATAIRPHGRVKRAATAILLGSIIHETQHLFGVGDSVS